MITFKTGDIFEENVQAIVNTVNCVGVMGRGIALQFKKRYSDNFKAYKRACKQGEVKPGLMHIFDNGFLLQPRYIINFPTKRHWRGASRIEDIYSGLTDLARQIEKLNITSIAIPPLGCGLGGLNWVDVRNIIIRTLSELPDVEIIVFEPNGTPSSNQLATAANPPKMTAGRAALIVLLQQYLNGLLDPFISLLEVQKLMYFMQEAGEPLRLHYIKHHYGPYADNLRHVLNTLEGHLLTGYSDGGDEPYKELYLLDGAYEQAQTFIQNCPETQHHLNRVSKLVQGFENSRGMELLASVHWVATREHAQSLTAIVEKIHQWNDHKKQFEAREIEITHRALLENHWL